MRNSDKIFISGMCVGVSVVTVSLFSMNAPLFAAGVSIIVVNCISWAWDSI
jgi:hypothetical protein